MPSIRTIMDLPHPSRNSSAFEIGGSDRIFALEGLRGIAVALVFLQHYCMQMVTYGHLSGLTYAIANIGRIFGNCGVELFFVLSGFLIYGLLLKKRPSFFNFMGRRLKRLYPAFVISVVLGIIVDFWRPIPKIPVEHCMAIIYLAENFAFLPGLLPIDAISAPNWSLSYEWWFYVAATLLFSALGLARLCAAIRVIVIVASAVLLLGLSACDVANVPVRGLCLLAGMFLAEANIKPFSSFLGVLGFGFGLFTFVLHIWVSPPAWLGALLLAFGFWVVCAAALDNKSTVSAWLKWAPLRHFGNMSYSYYLVHAFVVVPATRIVLNMVGTHDLNPFFWAAMVPVFILTWAAGATLFLTIERPWSLSKTGFPITRGREDRPAPVQKAQVGPGGDDT